MSEDKTGPAILKDPNDLKTNRHYKQVGSDVWYRCSRVERARGYATMVRLSDGEEFDVRISFWLGRLQIGKRGFLPPGVSQEETDKALGKPERINFKKMATSDAVKLASKLLRF